MISWYVIPMKRLVPTSSSAYVNFRGCCVLTLVLVTLYWVLPPIQVFPLPVSIIKSSV